MLRKSYDEFIVPLIFLILISGCASLPQEFDQPVSYAYMDTDDTTLGKARRSEIDAHKEESGFLLLGNGLDAFVARAVLASKAERSIDLQYFIYHDDLVARLLTDQLIKASDRGVRVRILVDDIATGGQDLGAAALDNYPNIEVRLLNPFIRDGARALQFLTRYSSATRRMHNKSFTVDNQVSILGGRNIGNEYFDADPDFVFSDLDVLCIGPVAKDVSEEFDLYWNSELAYPASVLLDTLPTQEEIQQKRKELSDFVANQNDSPYLEALRNSDLAKMMRNEQVSFDWGKYEVIYDLPEKLLQDKSETEYHLSKKLEPYVDQIKEELIIFSPYFVPGKTGVANLTSFSKRGVRVRILTNSLASNNHAIVHSGYSKYRKGLLREGIELYELNVRFSWQEKKENKSSEGAAQTGLHTKSFVFDRSRVFIGSLNLDPVALYNNTEIGVVITQDDIAERMGNWFDENIEKIAFRLELVTDQNGVEKILWHGIEDGKEVTFTKEPYTGFWKRFGTGFMSIFPIDKFL
jgi:putative cardiolipin synthase